MRYAILPTAITFPKANTVTLIRCSPLVIPSILTPERFPNLKTVHYLSAHPGKVDLYSRFLSPVDWVFPNGEYPFYARMMEAGCGRMDPQLISSYVMRQVYSRQRPHRSEFDLHIPGLDIMNGVHYRTSLYRYLYMDRPSSACNESSSLNWDLHPYRLLPSTHRHVHDLYLRQKTDQAFYQCLIDEDIWIEPSLPDATPCRSSSM